MRKSDEAAFAAYVTVALPRLRRIGFLVCGDWHRSEDAVSQALVRLYQSWSQIVDRNAVDAYARTILVRLLIDESRRSWRREQPRETLPERVADTTDSALVLSVRDALRQVPARQRAALVLRYYEQCDVAETAQVLRCSTGTVKSQTARGLARLRELLGDSMFADADLEGN